MTLNTNIRSSPELNVTFFPLSSQLSVLYSSSEIFVSLHSKPFLNREEIIMNDMKNQPESYWKEKLTPEQYKVVRQKGTERPFSGTLYYNHEAGMYNCAA